MRLELEEQIGSISGAPFDKVIRHGDRDVFASLKRLNLAKKSRFFSVSEPIAGFFGQCHNVFASIRFEYSLFDFNDRVQILDTGAKYSGDYYPAAR